LRGLIFALLRGHFATKWSVPHEAETRKRMKVLFVEKNRKVLKQTAPHWA